MFSENAGCVLMSLGWMAAISVKIVWWFVKTRLKLTLVFGTWASLYFLSVAYKGLEK